MVEFRQIWSHSVQFAMTHNPGSTLNTTAIQNELQLKLCFFRLVNDDSDKSRLEKEVDWMKVLVDSTKIQVDSMKKQLNSIESLLREVLNQQRVPISYSR